MLIEGIGSYVKSPVNLMETLKLLRSTTPVLPFVGSLNVRSYARPGKLFTANHSLMVVKVGGLKPATFKQIIERVVGILQANL
jgi:hypothetical protein